MWKLAIPGAALIFALHGCKDRDEAETEGVKAPAAAGEQAPAREDAAQEPAEPEEPPVLGTERLRLVEGGEPVQEVAWEVPGAGARLRIETGGCEEGAACEMQVVAALDEETYELHRFSEVTPDHTIEAVLDESGHPHVMLVAWEGEVGEIEANTIAVRLTWDEAAGRPRAGGTWEMPGDDPDPDTIDLGEGH